MVRSARSSTITGTVISASDAPPWYPAVLAPYRRPSSTASTASPPGASTRLPRTSTSSAAAGPVATGRQRASAPGTGRRVPPRSTTCPWSAVSTTTRPASAAAFRRGRRVGTRSRSQVMASGSSFANASSMVFSTAPTTRTPGSAIAASTPSGSRSPPGPRRSSLWNTTPPVRSRKRAFSVVAEPTSSSPASRDVRENAVTVGRAARAGRRRCRPSGSSSSQPRSAAPWASSVATRMLIPSRTTSSTPPSTADSGLTRSRSSRSTGTTPAGASPAAVASCAAAARSRAPRSCRTRERSC